MNDCAECGRKGSTLMVMGRGPFCGLTCTILGTRDMITEEDKQEAKRMQQAFGWRPVEIVELPDHRIEILEHPAVTPWFEDDEQIMERFRAWEKDVKGPPPNWLAWSWQSASPSLRAVGLRIAEKDEGLADQLVHEAFLTRGRRTILRYRIFLDGVGS